jgi:hypothetical protein
MTIFSAAGPSSQISIAQILVTVLPSSGPVSCGPEKERLEVIGYRGIQHKQMLAHILHWLCMEDRTY